MEDFKKLTITEKMESEQMNDVSVSEEESVKSKTLDLLRKFLAVQQRRAEAYAKLRE